jgi:Uncharacterised protein family (UPF0158)
VIVSSRSCSDCSRGFVSHRGLIARLEVAIDGRGAFRRFKNVLFDWPDDREEWFAFSDERRRGRAREWLADVGYRPAARPRSVT